MNRATQWALSLTMTCLVLPVAGETVQWRPAARTGEQSTTPVRLTRPEPLLAPAGTALAPGSQPVRDPSPGVLRPVFRGKAEVGFSPLPQGPYSLPTTPLPGEPVYLTPGCCGPAPCCSPDCCQLQGMPCCDGNGCQSPRLEVGLGFYFLRPRWDDAAAFNLTTTTTNAIGTVTDTSTNQANLAFDSSFAPKIWAAYSTEDGLTGRLSYFYLDSTTSTSVQQFPDTATTATVLTIPAGNNADPTFVDLSGLQIFLGAGLGAGQANVVNIDSRLRLQSLDFDVTQQCQLGLWHLNVGGGLRYARLEQTYNAYINRAGIAGGGLVRNTQHLSNVFEGAGVQAVAELRRALGQGLGLSVYGNARAGILFGESRVSNINSLQTDASGAVVIGAPGPVYTVNRRAVTQDDSLPYVELEAGLEWSQNYGGATPFARVGVVGQHWFGTGSPSSSSYNRHGDLGLFGLQVAAGVRY